MDELTGFVGSSPASRKAREGPVLGEDRVREIVSRLERGEGNRTISRDLGVDRKTVKRWRRLGDWQPRVRGKRPRALDGYAGFLEQRGPEVGWNGSVLAARASRPGLHQQLPAGAAHRARAGGRSASDPAPEGCETGRSGQDARLSWETMLTRELRSILRGEVSRLSGSLSSQVPEC